MTIPLWPSPPRLLILLESRVEENPDPHKGLEESSQWERIGCPDTDVRDTDVRETLMSETLMSETLLSEDTDVRDTDVRETPMSETLPR